MKDTWINMPLGAVSDINYGYTESASLEVVGPRFLRITDIQNDQVDWPSVPYCTIPLKNIPKYRLSTGDIVFARTGATTGKSFLVIDPPEAVFASYLIRLRLTNTRLLPEFLSLFFQTDTYWQSIKEGSTGSAQGGFNATKLAALSVPIPPVIDQKRIVALLKEVFEEISTAVANTQKSLVNVGDLFESYLNSIFLTEKAGWTRKPFGQICKNLDGKRVPITKSDRVSGEVPYYGASGIVDHVAGYIFDERILLISEDGANLLARTYPIAFSVSGKCWVNNHAHVVRFENAITQRWVELYINSINLDAYVSGMAQPKLNQKSLNSIPIPLPSFSDQVRIVNQIEILQTEVARLKAIYSQKLEFLSGLKQTVLQKAFAGGMTDRAADALIAAAE